MSELFGGAIRSGDSVYEHLRSSEFCEEEREFLEAKWRQFKAAGLADPAFLSHFPRECSARIWEIRLACLLLDWRLKLVASPDPGAGMDFGIVLGNGSKAWVDATVPTAGTPDGPNSVDAPLMQALHGEELDRTTALRYLGAIESKRKQFARARSAGLVGASDGLVVAISGSDIPLSDLEPPGRPPLIACILFGIGEPFWSVPIGGPGRAREGGLLPRPSIAKHGTSPITATLFLSESSSDVSAVLFDPMGVKNRPEARGRAPGHDLILVHNPFAAVPLPVGALPGGREFFMGLERIDHREPREPAV